MQKQSFLVLGEPKNKNRKQNVFGRNLNLFGHKLREKASGFGALAFGQATLTLFGHTLTCHIGKNVKTSKSVEVCGNLWKRVENKCGKARHCRHSAEIRELRDLWKCAEIHVMTL